MDRTDPEIELAPGSVVRLHCRAPRGSRVGRRTAEPVTCGVPWPRGVVGPDARLALVDGAGRAQLVQSRVLDRWPDGSVRWALLDWQVSVDDGATCLAGVAAGADPAGTPGGLVAELLDGRLAVDTGAARFSESVGGRLPFDEVAVSRRPAIDPERSGLRVVDAAGRRYRAEIRRLELAEAGPVRVAVRLGGRLVTPEGPPLADLTAWLHLFRGSAAVRLELTITNPRPAGHPGGFWGLGNAGSVYLGDVALCLALPPGGAASAGCSLAPADPVREVSQPLEIYQDSSGGENWRSSSHVNRDGGVPIRFRGYRLRRGEDETFGRRATPIVSLTGGESTLAATMRHFWQCFPTAMEVADRAVTIRLFPRQWSDGHELQGGEQSTSVVHLAFAEDRVTAEPLAWAREPLLAHAEPGWYARAAAVPGLLPRAEDSSAGYQRLVEQAIEGDDTFVDKREAIDEYGWRHFGDLWADHEKVFHDGDSPPVSHYNNQYDAVAGCAIQFLRSTDERWYHLMDEMARHVVDIDRYHTRGDKSAYNGGMFWHTAHYVDAGLSGHRSFPTGGEASGGPGPGHLYANGLMLHHLLTGNTMSRQAVVELGRYVIDADDGAQSVFRFLDRGDTGHATSSGFDDFHGPGRSAANSLSTLLDAHRLTGDGRFLDKAERIVRRCIHPADDLDARRLGDVEQRWFYTMFLQSLGKYLDHKAELGELDTMYAYGRAALLHYGEWALLHERPYLDQPERLEYPTETWAAQEMRKSELFHLAARHAPPERRAALREQARFFYRYAIDELGSMESRSLCRPVVLLLSCGYRQAHFERHREPAPPPAVEPEGFGQPELFVPQKRRVKRKLLLTAGGLGALLVAAWLLMSGCGAATPLESGTEAGGLTVYRRLDFDDDTGGLRAAGSARLELTADAVSGRALAIQPRRKWAGARLALRISGSQGLKVAFFARGLDYPRAQINAYDAVAGDNTTSLAPRFLTPDRWTPVLYSLDRFSYNSRPGRAVDPRTDYTEIRFFGPQPTAGSRLILDNLVIYRGRDDRPPAAVDGLEAKAVAEGIEIGWRPAADNGAILGYVVSRRLAGEERFVKLAEVASPRWLDRSGSPGTAAYRVLAVDFERNLGPWSEALTVEQPAAGAAAAEPRPAPGAGVDAERLREVHARGAGRVSRGHVCFFGDSLTGATVYGRLGEAALGIFTVAANGAAGIRTEDGRRRVAAVLEAENPEFLLVLLGTNNLAIGRVPDARELASWMADMRAIAEQAHERGTVALFATVPPRGFDDPSSRPEAAYNEALRELGRELGVPVADVFARLQAGSDRRQYLAEDGVHWRPAGMEVAARTWAETLRRVEWVLRDR